MIQHLCKDRPGYVEGESDPWVDGDVTPCPYHDVRGRKQLGYREGRGDRRKKDQAAGVVGVDRGYNPTRPSEGGYIHGV